MQLRLDMWSQPKIFGIVLVCNLYIVAEMGSVHQHVRTHIHNIDGSSATSWTQAREGGETLHAARTLITAYGHARNARAPNVVSGVHMLKTRNVSKYFVLVTYPQNIHYTMSPAVHHWSDDTRAYIPVKFRVCSKRFGVPHGRDVKRPGVERAINSSYDTIAEKQKHFHERQ